MATCNSKHDTEISNQDHTKQLLRTADQWLAVSSIFLWILGTVVVAVLAMVHKSIDYTLFTIHPMIYPYVYRLSFLLSLLAIIIRINRDGSAFVLHNPAIAFFGFTAVWIVISAFTTCSFEYFIHQQEVRGESAVIQIYYLVILFPSAALISDETLKKNILRSMLILSVILAAAAFVLWHTQDTSDVFLDWKPAFTSIYANINYYGYILSMTVPLSVAAFSGERSTFWRWLSLAVLVLNTIALVLNTTRSALLACVLSVFLFLSSKRTADRRTDTLPWMVVVMFLVCLIAAICAVKPLRAGVERTFKDICAIITGSESAAFAGSRRWGIWKTSVEYIRRNPLFGIGFEGILTKELIFIFGRQPRPHNEYLQYALFYGFPAGVTYLAGCFSVFYRALKQTEAISAAAITALMGALGYLISAFFGLTLSYITPFMFILLGLGYAEKQSTEAIR